MSAQFHVGKNRMDLFHGAVDLFEHIVMIKIHFPADRFCQFAVFIVKLHFVLYSGRRFFFHFGANTQCSEHLHGEAGFFIHLVLNELFQFIKAAFLP